jgi:hypothetical protein
VLSVGWLVAAVVVAIVLTMWVTFTLTRLDRLHARVDAAGAAMDAQLVRRAAALQLVAESMTGVPAGRRAAYELVARDALRAGPDRPEAVDDTARRAAENAVGHAVAELVEVPDGLDPAAVAELREASARVLIARRFYNDAVRDTRALRARRLPRLFRMAGRRELPQFFDIDDTLPPAAPPRPETSVLSPSPEEDRS